jgi:hypothetical protein
MVDGKFNSANPEICQAGRGGQGSGINREFSSLSGTKSPSSFSSSFPASSPDCSELFEDEAGNGDDLIPQILFNARQFV